MSWIHYDPDEWESVYEHRPCTACHGDRSKCNGQCNAMSSYSQRRRPKEEVFRIKAERRRREEDEILARAKVIRAQRRLSREATPSAVQVEGDA